VSELTALIVIKVIYLCIVLQVLAAIYFCDNCALALDHFLLINIRHPGYVVAAYYEDSHLLLSSQ